VKFKLANQNIIKQKEEEVKALAAKMKDAKLVLLTNYRGINVADDTALRKSVREIGAEYSVIKNNITRRALKECGIDTLDEVLEGPTAVIMCEDDYLATAKLIYKFTKDHDFYKIKGGIVEGKVMTTSKIITLAKLPSRQELLSKLAGSLLGNITKLAVALNQVKVQKEA
jgi:large subunit ribosomal protein L10